MDASGKFQLCFISVSQVIQESFKGPFKQVLRGVSRGVQEFFIEVSRKFQDTFLSV